ncbi:GNAT family N-acetyltransferase [Aliinostoc sp. HNIBRCY26]|uniref:GNAT family N-acetyltransferase n=1 Tax=Aliinostoc sp. HNIBRCY26 TaxID=3418997 RepID=UPI003CFDFE5C
MPEIETARLKLRHFTLDDFGTLFRLYSDTEVMRYLSLRTQEQTQESLIKHIQHWEKHNFGMWAVVHKDSCKMIGRCGLGFLEDTPEVELGYVLDKSYWNMGLGTEASQATLKYGFLTVQLDQIVAIARPENIASRRVIEKLGMRYQKHTHHYGVDVVYYSLAKSEWQPDNSLSSVDR